MFYICRYCIFTWWEDVSSSVQLTCIITHGLLHGNKMSYLQHAPILAMFLQWARGETTWHKDTQEECEDINKYHIPLFMSHHSIILKGNVQCALFSAVNDIQVEEMMLLYWAHQSSYCERTNVWMSWNFVLVNCDVVSS